MRCEAIHDGDVIEQYLLGRLTDADREAFEAHVFECDRCLGALETTRALREELSRQRAAILTEPAGSRPAWPWMLAAAAALLAAAVGSRAWLLRSGPAEEPRAVVSGAPPPVARAPMAPAESIQALAAIDPPRYVPFAVRGADDERSRRFESAMRNYVAGDYRRASIGLRRMLADDPSDVEANFFLGIALLMTDDVDGAIQRLRQTVAQGASPFQQTASFDLSKALMRKGDLDAAEQELSRTIDLPGSHGADASNLLKQLRALRSGPR
jgi:tetratricopeptide (TPR) repeat protein